MPPLLRALFRSPAFSITTTLLLALGIGSAALLFSAYDAIVLRSLPVAHPEQLVRIEQVRPVLGTRSWFPYLYYALLRDQAKTVEVFGEAERQLALTSPEPTEEIRLRYVTPEFFEQLGVPAMLGRYLTRADGVASTGTPPVVLSYRFWQRRFGADPRVVGQTLAIHGVTFTIAGIMPPTFRGTSADSTPDVRVPIWTKGLIAPNTGGVDTMGDIELSARLRPGVTPQRAYAEALALWRAAYQQVNPDVRDIANDTFFQGLRVAPLVHGVSIVRDKFGSALSLLTATAGLLLLMVCFNLAGLMLARAAGRRQDVAVRMAMGASRSRIFRQSLAESALLAGMGCAAGLAFAYLAAPMLAHALPPLRDLTMSPAPLALDLHPSARVVLCSIAAAAFAALLFALAPAGAVSAAALESVLRGVRSSSRVYGRNALLVFQIALCAFLLAGAGLLSRTFAQLRDTPSGYDAAHVAVFTASIPQTREKPDPAIALQKQLMERIRALPSVVSAAYAGMGVLRGLGQKNTFIPPGRAATAADFLNNNLNQVSPEYFDTLGMKIVEGRGLTPDDRPSAAPENVLVNESFVRHFFPGEHLVGRDIYIGLRPPLSRDHVVGVVTDAHYRSLREAVPPIIYELAGPHDLVIYVRVAGDPASIVEPVRKALNAINPALPFTEIDLLSDEVSAASSAERLTAQLVSVFAAIAAIIAAVGIYGLFAYVVAQRRREIGIRIAVGAQTSDITGLIGWQAARTAIAGIALGIGAAWYAAPLIQSLLYNVEPHDPAALLAAALFLGVVAALAVAAPAWRASRIHPTEALRCD